MHIIKFPRSFLYKQISSMPYSKPVQNDEVRRTTGQPHNWLLFKRSVSPSLQLPHCANARWNRCQDLNGFLLEKRRRPPGRIHTMWINTTQLNLKSN